MHVLLNVGRQVKVDYMFDMGYVKAAGGHSRGDQDRGVAGAELAQGVFALPLAAVTVNGGHRVALVVQEVFQGVGPLFGLDED